MRHLLLALPLTLLPLASQAGEAHVHGVARLDVAVAGSDLEIELTSPAFNLVGFEYAPRKAPDQAAAVQTRHKLEKPQSLLGLPDCELQGMELDGTLLSADIYASSTKTDDEHSDATAMYHLNCPQPAGGLDVAELLKQFPGIEKIEAQVVGPKGQAGATLTRASSKLSF